MGPPGHGFFHVLPQDHVLFRANDTPEAKQREIFLASGGTRVFSLLLDLLKLAMPHVKTLGELLAILRSHFNPAPSTLMERFRFNNRSRREGETVGQFVPALRGLTSACVFGDLLDSLLRDRFLGGINNHAMQARLLELLNPSLDDAVKVALAMEAAAEDAGEIARATGSQSAEAVFKKLATKGSTSGRCDGAYSPSQCQQFYQAQCFTCGKIGHLARVCRRGRTNSGMQQQPGSSPGTTQDRGQGSRRKATRRGHAAAGSSSSVARLYVVAEDPPIFDMWHTGCVPSSVPPYVLTVEICGHPISMELDKGASVSVMARKWFKRTFPGVSVEASGVMLRSYSGQFFQVQGQAQPRPLPFALKDGVTQELQRLQREGIPVPFKKFEWAYPIVPVLKREGSVKICGDIKVTIKAAATVEKYPLLRIEDLWSALSGGQKLTKRNLRDAYQQLVLQDASRKYAKMSTTLPPAILQRDMDNLFRGMRHVAVCLDDILVTGSDDRDHLQNLHNVLVGPAPAPPKVHAVSKAPKPQNKKELQSYLGCINFYRSFLPNVSEHLQPLHLLLRDDTGCTGTSSPAIQINEYPWDDLHDFFHSTTSHEGIPRCYSDCGSVATGRQPAGTPLGKPPRQPVPPAVTQTLEHPVLACPAHLQHRGRLLQELSRLGLPCSRQADILFPSRNQLPAFLSVIEYLDSSGLSARL
ncbi:uncharacterized protein [Dermacentor albipictus]|uniref:uncharacterized protein n=1 Tax=Dermacentor albipictus TaxID=60249 RepID=UPI0038FC7490